MVEQAARTHYLVQYSWSLWKPDSNIPDIAPGAVESNLLLSIRDAMEFAVTEILFKATSGTRRKSGNIVNLPSAIEPVTDGPRCLEDLYTQAFTNLDSEAMRILSKVFNVVNKTYYTVIFNDPSGKNRPFLAYASPKMHADLESLLNQLQVDQSGPATLASKLVKLRSNACIKFNGRYLCNKPVSGRVMCSYWAQPEAGNRYQCYYQERNKDMVDISGCFLCQCESAWKDCDPTYQPSVY